MWVGLLEYRGGPYGDVGNQDFWVSVSAHHSTFVYGNIAQTQPNIYTLLLSSSLVPLLLRKEHSPERRRFMAVARLIRPLRQWPQVQNRYRSLTVLDRLLFSSSLVTVATIVTLHSFSFATDTSSRRSVCHRSRGLRLPNSPTLPNLQKEDGETGDSDTDGKTSRNQKKREVAALGQEVFEALTLVKRLGPNVREGKRTQFNYIGKLLREVEPELMDTLIQAANVGDQITLQHLASLQPQIMEDEDDDEESESEDEDEVSQAHTNIASRWFDGLITSLLRKRKKEYLDIGKS
ncbi:hypothetical protein SLEP1_g55558 [Rubroshorea leprosula]|uniref:Uncharacterized protein n=1 Tax=Rubroshorea leprosula TaxID=152421 RepID=A0AAV5MHW9_9ROSI|nr:hypothetical protein SLEP1_g55558 [Rubroshorea leprosula]